jgi:hypothetical protein
MEEKHKEKENRRPPVEMYLLARTKLGVHEDILKWFFKPIDGDEKTTVTPQHLLNINADDLITTLLNEMPDLPEPLITPEGLREQFEKETGEEAYTGDHANALYAQWLEIYGISREKK